MRKKDMLIGLVGVVVGMLLASVVVVLAGDTDSPADPTNPASQMYTLKQIYDRLDSGAETAKMTSFTEPDSGPGSTMHTLNDVMGKAPAADNTDGATTANVANGKTFWGLNVTAGEWGLQTGERYGGCTCTGIITPTGGTPLV